MLEESRKKYRIYEYIRDSDSITAEMSNTKDIILKLQRKDKKTKKYCKKKMREEKQEVKEAMKGKHFHKDMSKREILVNEIAQYMYWQTLIAVSKNISYQEFKEEEKIRKIVKAIDLRKIGEKEGITVKEILLHDLEEMATKAYLREVI